MVVYEAGTGSLCLAIPVTLTSGDVAWTGRHTETLFTSDGAARTKVVDNIKRLFGWNGLLELVNPQNPEEGFILEGLDPDNQVSLEFADCHVEEYTPQGSTEVREVFKIGWMNPPGGASNMPEPVSDRNAFLAKWSSKFKAVSGGGSKKQAVPSAAAAGVVLADPQKAAAAPQRAAAAPAGPSRRTSNATSAMPRTSTLDEVWAGLKKKHPSDIEDSLNAKFWDAVDACAPGSNGENLPPAKWGEIADKLGV
jgi:hypothetical protein